MIGHQLLVIEKEDETFIADRVSCWFSVELSVAEAWDSNVQAKRIYEAFGDSEKEFPLTKDDLIATKNASSSIPNTTGYHPNACDGVIIIPKTKDKFISINTYLGIDSKYGGEK